MEHTNEPEDLNKKSLEKIDEYLRSKTNLGEEHHEKLYDAKKKSKAPGQILWMFSCTRKDLKYEVLFYWSFKIPRATNDFGNKPG